MTHRVVITGLGLASPIGHTVAAVSDALRTGKHGIKIMPQWAEVDHLATRLAAPITDLELRYPRKRVRGMGRVGLLSTYASEAALKMAALDPEHVKDGRTGIAYGSTAGSSEANEAWTKKVFLNGGFTGVTSTEYLRFMSHTCAANLATYFEVKGRVISTCSACTSASQGIGAGYEAIKFGLQDVMICGGAEELHFTHAGVFDVLRATSRNYNERPELSPRPFDKARDGLVVGEGAGTVILESYENATARGATILGEIIGYGTNCDGGHVTNPSAQGMAGAMSLALADAGLSPDAIDYINAHATATEVGDIAESRATHSLFGEHTPVSSTKSTTGHTLGACGAIELTFCLAMMAEGWIAPNRNLDEVDERCAPLDYVREVREAQLKHVMTNNFAFGGINTSLILGRV